MSQSDHTSNFHDYVIISVHIRLFFVSVAQFFAKLILSEGQFHKKNVASNFPNEMKILSWHRD